MEAAQGFDVMDTFNTLIAGAMGLWLITAAVVWLVVAIITAMVAQSKGYSGAGGFFAGLFLGLIGLLIYGCMADAVSQRHLERIAQLLEHQSRVTAATPPHSIPPPSG